MTTGPEEGQFTAPDEGPGGMPLALRLSEGLGAGAETRYLRPWQMHALCGLGAVGGLFCFWLGLGAPGLDPLFRVLVGAGVGVALPFAGAMVTGAK